MSVTVVLAAAVVAMVAALVLTVRTLTAAHGEAQAQWASERRELLERIQRPDRMPVLRDAPTFEIPEREPDEWASVGQIDIDPDYGLEED